MLHAPRPRFPTSERVSELHMLALAVCPSIVGGGGSWVVGYGRWVLNRGLWVGGRWSCTGCELHSGCGLRAGGHYSFAFTSVFVHGVCTHTYLVHRHTQENKTAKTLRFNRSCLAH